MREYIGIPYIGSAFSFSKFIRQICKICVKERIKLYIILCIDIIDFCKFGC